MLNIPPQEGSVREASQKGSLTDLTHAAATTVSPTSFSLQLCLEIDDETKGWV